MKFEPWTFAYEFFGGTVERFLPYFGDLHNSMKEGGVRISLSAYLSFMVLMSIIAFMVPMIILPFLFPLILRTSIAFVGNFVLSFMISVMSAVLTFIALYSYPTVKASARKNPIEINLAYTLNFLTLLSSSNVPPRAIFRSMATIDTLKSVRQEFSNIIRDVEIFGQDILTSILNNVNYTPSKSLRDILSGYVATIRTGGDPTEFLRISTENAMKEKMIKLDTMLESLSALAEIYIMVLVAMPLLFTVMFATLGMLGGGGGASNLGLMLYLLTYAFIPIAAVVLMLVLSTFEVG